MYTRIRLGMILMLGLLALHAIGQVPGKVGSLLAADRAAARRSASEGAHAALSSISDRNSIFFVPSPTNALAYLNSRPNIPDVLKWETNFSIVSRSLEWGVTSGPLTFQRIGARQRNGEFLTIWKRDRKGDWKVALRAEIEHYGTEEKQELRLIEPENTHYVKHRSQVRLAQRNEIVMSNEKLFATVLRGSTEKAYGEFLAEDARLLFPWNDPINGKDNIIDFLKKQKFDIILEPEKVDRAYSGEVAYSYGTATLYTGDKGVKYNYLRVWQLQDDFQWRVLIDMYILK